MLRYLVTEPVFVFCSLPQGETDRHIKAFIYKVDGSFAVGGDGSIPLFHQSNGLYKSLLNFNLAEGLYKVLYKPFLDAGYTQPDIIYGTKEETLEVYSDVTVDISTIENKIDQLSASLVDSNYEIQLEEAEELSIDVESEDELELEIEE